MGVSGQHRIVLHNEAEEDIPCSVLFFAHVLMARTGWAGGGLGRHIELCSLARAVGTRAGLLDDQNTSLNSHAESGRGRKSYVAKHDR